MRKICASVLALISDQGIILNSYRIQDIKQQSAPEAAPFPLQNVSKWMTLFRKQTQTNVPSQPKAEAYCIRGVASASHSREPALGDSQGHLLSNSEEEMSFLSFPEMSSSPLEA